MDCSLLPEAVGERGSPYIFEYIPEQIFFIDRDPCMQPLAVMPTDDNTVGTRSQKLVHRLDD